MPLHTVFTDTNDQDEVMKQIRKCRAIMGNKNSTNSQWEWVGKMLAGLYVECDESLTPILLAQLSEYDMRMSHRITHRLFGRNANE